MKKQPTIKTFVGAVLFALLSQSTLLAQDAHVSLWNFDSGDLSATAGADMEYMEDTGDLVTFGTTEALGLPAVGGEVANVIQIPKLVTGQGLLATLPEDSNGEGDLVNNWTAIMDVYYPVGSAGKKRSLIDVVTAEWVAGAADAEFYVSAANAVGTSGLDFGNVTPGEWHRIAIAINIEGLWGKVYIDGQHAGSLTAPEDSLDGRWSLDTAFEQFVTFFNDDNNESEEVFVSSIQLRFETLNSGQILALGGAAAAGVPEELPPVPSFVDQWTPSGKYAKADTALSVVINSGDTTISNTSISLTLNGVAVATDIASADGTLTVTASGAAALASGAKYELALTYTDSVAGEQTQNRKFEVPVYFEDFDSVELGPNVDELAVDNEFAWTRIGPEGWTVDASGVPGNSEDHVGYVADEDEDGFPDNDGVTEWAGWSFADFNWWVQVAGDQSRSSFSLARNVVAVADPDEWDDKAHADGAANGWYKTFMTTPEIDVSGITAGTLFANFHSSWRPEFDGNYHQEGYILASYDGAEPVEILTWVSDQASANYHDHNQNEVVTLPLNNPDGSQKLQLTFGMREAGNDWWWAIDNLVINAGVVPPLIATQPTGTEVSEGEAFALSVVAEGGEPLSYQWYKDGVVIDGATSADFAVGQASVADAGKYSVKITNEGGDITSGDAFVGVQASLGITIWSEDFEGLTLGPNVDEGVAGDAVWTKTAPDGWVINDEEVPGTWAWQGIDDEEGHPENDGVTEWAGWSFANAKWWIQTAGDQRRSEFKKAIGTAAVADGDEWDDLPREGGNMFTFMTTGDIAIDGIMENSLVFRFHSSWRPEVVQTATIEATFDDGDAIEIMRWESEGGDAEFYHDHEVNETVNIPINNPAGAKTVKLTIAYLDAGNNWWWAIDNLILAGEPEPIFAENFDSLELDAFESSSETGGDGTDWTADTPTGWVMTRADDHGPTADGDAVKEFDGWTFMDPVSWNATAGQDRAEFTKGTGVIAVGDSDEYDDLADAKFNASLSTPAFSLDGVAAGTAILVYDSSWRQEPQNGTVSVSFDGGDPITLLTLTPDTPTAYNETVTLPLGNPDGASNAVITWDHQGHNNWWWAIDNIKVTVGKAPAGIVTQLTGLEATEGDGVSFKVEANGDEPIFYKWFKGDMEIAGAEGPVLELSNVSEEDAGSYTVEVSNSAGSATSNPARLAVLLKPGSTLVFAENFDSLELGPFVSDSESGGDGTDWTATAPADWVTAQADDHGPTDGGDDVVEFDGWTFLDPVSWNATAGQARGEFTKGTGVVAVGDSDEYDDKADAKFNASISTPAISIAGIDPGSLILKYDSSWRKEPQNGTVSVAYDGGDAVTLVTLTPDTPTGYNDTVTVRLDNPEGASSLVITWDHQGHNNWWWAIDNIEITGELQPIFAENFDSLELGPFVSDSESGGDGTDWTATAPEGWVMVLGDDHGPTDPANVDDVVEFDGWTFVDPVSWNATAGQARAEFTKGTGVVAVGDSDEYDDKADAKFNASLSTPAISLNGVQASSLVVRYDSSWRQEPQSGTVSISYDGGDPVTLVTLTPDTPTAYNETVVLNVDNPAGANFAVITWDHQGHNNWWWAIDNIVVYSTAPVEPSLPDNHYLVEDFDSLELGPFESGTESGGDGTDWTATAPSGWTMVLGPNHGPTAGGDAVKEFNGWTFMDPASWNATAGQDRAQFTKGTGVVAVGDSDEYDDAADAKFDAALSTPALNVAGAAAGSLYVTYDSSWRQEPQQGKVLVSFDGGEPVVLLELTPDTPTAYNETVTLALNNPEGVNSVVVTWDHQGHNNWWWAIDNVSVYAKAVLPEGYYFVENFDDLELGPFVSDSESGGDGTDWTATAPADWVQATGEGHGPTAGGDVAVEFDGWTFLDPVSWNATAGQDRVMFTKGTGVVAVGDSDEYDDKADAKFNASLSTPAIDISGASAGSLLLTYDSSWRQEPQSGKVLVSYDGGEAVTLLELTPDTPTAYDESVELELNNPEGASSAVITWDHQGHNNWWWAIDNIAVKAKPVGPGPDDPAVVTDKATYLSGEDITVNFRNGLGNPKDWVGIYKPEGVPGDVGSTKWSYVSGSTTAGEGLTDGAIIFAGGLPAGSYVARFFENDGYTQIADAAAFTVVDPPSVTTSRAKFAAGSPITVNFNSGPGNPKDWVGLYRPDMTPGDVGSLKWTYVSGTQTAGDGLTDGSVTLEGLDAGDYFAIFFENDGYTQLAKTSFSVVSEDGIFYAENFDSLELGPFVSDSESGGDGTDWTATGPEGWIIALGDDHGPTADGDDVVEFDGWTFLDPVSWNATAGQDRAQFTKGTGVVAVGDSDEYDDKVDAKFNSSLSTPEIDISGAAAGSLVLTYDSSWRQEPQQGKVTVAFDGGDAVTLLELTPDTPTGYNDTVSLSLNNPAGASTAVVTWDHQGHNNWWWAIDNIMVTGESGSSGVDGLSSLVTGLSTQALDSLVAHYDGKTGVETDGASVVSWTPIDANGDSLDGMIVTSTQKGGGAPELITYDGSGKLTFDDTDVGADGRYLEGALSNAESKEFTVFWVGNYSADAPFATSGAYVYNIGINSTSHQRDDGAGGFVVEQYNGTTYAGDDITAYDGVSTVWSTVLTADSHAFYANGANLNVGGTPSNNIKANASMIIGAYSSSGYDFVGEVEQLIIFGSALSDADRKIVEGYLGVADEPATPTTILVDFGGAGEFGAGASPDPWITIDNLVMDEAASLGGGVTITALDDGFNPNNPAQPGEGAEHDGVSVPQEARNDYLFKIADAAGTTARMRIDGLAAGTYNVTVFEGRTTDTSQFAKIWTGEEPAAENTGDFAKGSATVTVTVGAGEPLWYMHLEDGSGGVSGLIIRPAADTPALSIVNNGDGTVTVTFEGKLQAAAAVNGPWADVEGAVSPQIIPVDQVMQFGRAVK